ncbi:mucin-3A-like [Muntiacus reevesi]|uniref:mucin-3A-like n=1 Tax=Muntiacus reevesi TaxID=9886 RepID=UPI0033075CD1
MERGNIPRAGAGSAPSLRGASGPMQFFRVLRLLWMLRAFLGSTGTAKWPLNTPKTYPTPKSRKNIPMTTTTSPNSKSLSKTLLKSPINSNPPTIPTSKFVFKVETSPPTMIVYMGSTECTNPTSLIITTTYPTTTCVSQTHVSFPSSHPTTPGTETPRTAITSAYPVSTTKRVTSAVTSPPTVTTPGKTPTTTAPLSSFVPATHTTPDTLISSMTGTTKRTTPAAEHLDNNSV